MKDMGSEMWQFLVSHYLVFHVAHENNRIIRFSCLGKVGLSILFRVGLL